MIAHEELKSASSRQAVNGKATTIVGLAIEKSTLDVNCLVGEPVSLNGKRAASIVTRVETNDNP